MFLLGGLNIHPPTHLNDIQNFKDCIHIFNLVQSRGY
nr:MAG TPA: hypothetical protein [Caudoviricetes sp.]